ncbi:hypothetical protein [Deinococcus actinosclerus]|uniref:Uncharacterized protein n=1 Tax=Deinococcus actinosclerus TaxID=1768108 RepID=A0ABM5X4W4_9DEIO|nr:hypothetical protein [Deinococcus actinosclerus]ALW88781.1 hypothetical protein AUC44_07645 [Deinococcus actinosclerus]
MIRSVLFDLGLTLHGLRCMGVSLRKRWWHPVLTLLFTTVVLLVVHGHLSADLLIGAAAALFHTAWIGLNSAYRHRHDAGSVMAPLGRQGAGAPITRST